MVKEVLEVAGSIFDILEVAHCLTSSVSQKSIWLLNRKFHLLCVH